MVSSKLRPHFTPGKDPIPILQEAGWAPWLVWTGGKSRPLESPVAQHTIHIARRTLSDVKLTQYDTLPQHKINVRKQSVRVF